MKYSVELRMKNPGPAKYLIDTYNAVDINEAFYIADEVHSTASEDHFVQIVDEHNEVIASFGNVVGAA